MWTGLMFLYSANMVCCRVALIEAFFGDLGCLCDLESLTATSETAVARMHKKRAVKPPFDLMNRIDSLG